MTDDAEDAAYMARALDLAARGAATVHPNPMVGCVIVRDGEVVGEGWHEAPGGPHAEIAALRQAGSHARGATAYVTLEPCAHHGRTGPCAPALVEAGIERVVHAVDDPNPAAIGGAQVLRDAGVEVTSGVGADQAEEQNAAFLHRHRTGRPLVTLKTAQTLDGRVAARDGTSRWITSEAARTEAHRLRAASDAVLVGSGTVLADDPRLDVRHVDPHRGQPRPVVLDRRGRTPADAQVARPGAIVITGRDADVLRERLTPHDVEVVEVTPGEDGGVALTRVLEALAARDVHALLVEGGPTVAAAFARQGLVDRYVLHLAPSLLGGDGRPSLAPPGAPTVDDRWRLEITSVRRLGPDLEVVARPAG